MPEDNFAAGFGSLEESGNVNAAFAYFKQMKDSMIAGGFSEQDALKIIAYILIHGKQR